MSNPDEQETLSLSEKIAFIDDQIVFLTKQYAALDTQIDATEQALAAMEAAQKNKQRITEIGDRLEFAIRSFQGFACVLTGAALLWFASPMVSDAITANDRLAEWLFMGGGGCIGYGLLVLTSNDARVLSWLEFINPWRK